MNIKAAINKIKNDRSLIYLLVGLLILLYFYQCPFQLVGLSCPGCGMTRAFFALLRLDFSSAFYYHPLWPLVIVVVVYLLSRYFAWFRLSEVNEKRLLVVIVLIFLGVYFYRLFISHSPVVDFIHYRPLALRRSYWWE